MLIDFSPLSDMSQGYSQLTNSNEGHDQQARSIDETNLAPGPVQYIYRFKNRKAKTAVKQGDTKAPDSQNTEELLADKEDLLIFDDIEMLGSNAADNEHGVKHDRPGEDRLTHTSHEATTNDMDEGYLSGLSSQVTSQLTNEEPYTEHLSRFHIQDSEIQDSDRDNEFMVTHQVISIMIERLLTHL